MPEMRRSMCRPQPSLLSRLNCKPCNHVLFFMVGVGLGALFLRNKELNADRQKEEK
ncbi:PREDICTED: uncharacterized protein LOC108611778 [Drosophila arizonae]|uniref:Uncharacterized protein LOC108611778 n=1 Tax=Drosophila arizonae TaxID=7263 RepID=A0ABM1NYM6_DROAR|nr:PREDICTED: uncharacterized protein LOC108611778 [Drosophila arizonae]